MRLLLLGCGAGSRQPFFTLLGQVCGEDDSKLSAIRWFAKLPGVRFPPLPAFVAFEELRNKQSPPAPPPQEAVGTAQEQERPSSGRPK
jgi:hypothetical protein